MRKNYRRFRHDCENIKRLCRSGEGLVVAENYYVLHKHFNAVSKRTFINPELNKIVYKYLLRADFNFSCGDMMIYFTEKSVSLSICDVYNLTSALSACLISAVGGECMRMLENRRGDGKRIMNAINSLRRLCDLDIEAVFDRFCPSEKLFEKYIPYFDRMDIESKDIYRNALLRYTAKHKINEEQAIERCALLTHGNPADLLLKDRKPLHTAVFYCVNLLIFIGFAIFAFCYFSWLALLMLPGLYEASVKLCEFVFPHFILPTRPLRLALDEVPNHAKTLIVTTTLLFGDDSQAFDRLEEFYLKNRKNNLYFGILGDFRDSSQPAESGDDETVAYARERIRQLNNQYGDVFSLFIRQRDFNVRDNIYSGRERKRGAVCDLVTLINGGGNAFAFCENIGYITDIAYVLTLDADTNLPIGGVLDLLGIMLHPRNKPVVKNGRVVSGYGILQPCMRTELASSYRTYFSLLQSGDGGGMYERAFFDRYQTLFGSGVFCGKGLLDARLFGSLARLPDGIVLSHDMPEGCLLRCMLVTDMTFTDSTPKNSLSFFTRLHRWIRGDVQNLALIGRCFKDFGSVYKIIENVRRHLIPVFCGLGLLCLAIFSGNNLVALLGFATLFAHLLIPAFLAVMAQLFRRSFTPRRFFSLVINSFLQNISVLMFEMSAIFEYAYTAADASVRSLYRMTKSKRKLLEWTTFLQSEGIKTDSFLYYIQKNMTSAVCGTIMFMLSPWIVFRIFGLICFLAPMISYLMARKIEDTSDRPTKRQMDIVRGYAADHFKFFAQRVGKKTNYLPPDNVQLSPADRVAYRTSPTNIGLYLTSLLAAYDFAFIDATTLCTSVKNTLDTLDRMEKWQGHLYNWYDIKTLEPLGSRYVSTVDSGNFVTMLITLAAGLDEIDKGLAQRCRILAEKADFMPLYNKKKNLLYLGYDHDKGDCGEICYDLLMSEIRTTCYYLTASGAVPKKHWRSLGRTIVENDGYIGMVSWSGTAFEYFMPELFLPRYKNSFIWESLQFAYYNQRKHRKCKVFGTSESGFYSFDSDMNYQYKAHGVQASALKRYKPDEVVISPYSSFLMLCVEGEGVLKNLETLREMGLYGEYGFYEAIDFGRPAGWVVRSYMSHHLGMSILACANFCFDSIFVKRFMSDKRLKAATELLCEKIPTDVHLFDEGDYSAKPEVGRAAVGTARTYDKQDLQNPQVALISSGGLTLAASSSGHISMRYGSYLVSNTVFDTYSARATAAMVFIRNGNAFGITPQDGNERFLFEKSDSHFAFVSASGDFPVSVAGRVLREDGVFMFSARWDRKIKTAVGFCFAPVLDTAASFYAHQAFSSLFVVSEYNAQKRVIIFKRRKRSEGERFPVCAVALSDIGLDFSFTTSAEGLTAGSIQRPSDYFAKQFDNDCGVCLTPLCALKTNEISSGEVNVLVATAYTVEDCLNGIERARRKRFVKSYEYSMNTLCEMSLRNILFAKNHSRLLPYNSKMLWKYGISGDFPLIVLNVFEDNRTVIGSAISAFLTLAAAFLRSELVFIVNERDRYLSPLREAVCECIAAMGCERFLSHRGGIHIINTPSGDELEFIKAFAVYYGESDDIYNETLGKSAVLPRIITRGTPIESPDDGIKVQGGAFVDGGFRVDKSAVLRAPYSYVLSGRSVGGVVTDKSLGFTFFMNARERKLSPFDTNPFYRLYGETLYIFHKDKIFDALACCGGVFYCDGCAVYRGTADDLEYKVTVFAASLMPYKVVTLQASQPVRAALAISLATRQMCAEKQSDCVMFVAMKNGVMDGTVGFVYASKSQPYTDLAHLLADVDCEKNDVAAVSRTDDNHSFFIGGAPNIDSARRVIALINPQTADEEKAKTTAFVKRHQPPVVLQSGDKILDSLFNHFVPYQIAFSRFFGKTGFYQTGGAYGFRDQLQDCLGMIFSAPRLVRTHIIRAAAHQYREGDVMHWWYKNSGETFGIRTKCSDDFLFLPLVTADYISKTGDYSLLDVQVAYLDSPPLGNHAERYEKAVKSNVSETIYLHCIRALAHGERYGRHGLSLMGSCDWNDAFSNIGINGEGESVFSSFLFILAIRAFLPIFNHFGDEGVAAHYQKVADKMAENIERHCFTGDRYLRAFFDDGTPLGSEECEECKIDILSQCFAAMVFGRTQRTLTALDTAYNALFDKQNNILKLFTPPFDKVNAGYIRGYAAGVRENGGQYTHAALWAVSGFIKAGEHQRALEILNAVNPAAHGDDYKIEPNAIAADIYSGERAGRGGWSWYTGSAAWFYRIMMEEVLGVKFCKNFNSYALNPIIPFKLTIGYNGEEKLIEGQPLQR